MKENCLKLTSIGIERTFEETILIKTIMTIREFTQKCRELQGGYRERMGEPMGVGPHLKNGTPQIICWLMAIRLARTL